MVQSKIALGRLSAMGTAMAVLLTGCSSGTTAIPPSSGSLTSAATLTQAFITDAPSSQVIALGLTINSIRLFDAAGNGTDVLTTPTTIEACHLDAVQEPLRANLNIPQGTYTSAVITVSNPTVTYVDPATGTVVNATATLTASTDTVTFAAPITVTATSSPIVFDLLVGQSVTLSGTTATVTPTFNVTQTVVSSSPSNWGNGRYEGLYGSVVSTSSTSVTLLTANGTQVVVSTDSSTVLQGFTALSQLTSGEVIDVDYAQQTNGTLLALRIHLHNGAAANEVIGLVTATTGSPITSFTETARQWLGSATASTTAGTTYTVTVNSSTTFAIASQFGTLPSLPFTPTFTNATLFAGQNVAVQASSISGSTAVAQTVTLLPQTVDGTVSAITTSGSLQVYTVTLTTGSSLATLTGASSVQVYTTGLTQHLNAATIAVGSTVRLNGLLFKNAGTLSMIAGGSFDGEHRAPQQHY